MRHSLSHAWVSPSTHSIHFTNVNNICRTCYFYIRRLRYVRSAMSTDTTKTVTCAIVSSRLDCCNALLAGMSESNLDKLQHVQNTLTYVINGLCRRDHITPAIKELYWLPIRARIMFKVVTVVYNFRERRQRHILSISSMTTYRWEYCDHRRVSPGWTIL